MKGKKILMAIIGILLLSNLISSRGNEGGEITIEKMLQNPGDEIKVNEVFTVIINVTNNYDKKVTIRLEEIIDFGEPVSKENTSIVYPTNVTDENNEGITINGIKWLYSDGKCVVGCNKDDNICDPDCSCTAADDDDCMTLLPIFSPYYEWKLSLEAGKSKELWYEVKPTKLGAVTIKPTIAYTASLGTFYSNPLEIQVRCNGDKICERIENFKNCPEDCPSGGNDDYCDKVRDGICDPNCPKNSDPDCIKPSCGDGNCEKVKGENYESCPSDCKRPVICGDSYCDYEVGGENFLKCKRDCHSGGKDDYCDGIKDKICDPDCTRNLDEDCVCDNNGVCEKKYENFGNCKVDCPSGGADGYCDGIGDNICDPDCSKGEDPDCGKNDTLFYALIVFSLIVIFTIGYLYMKRGRGGKYLESRNED